MPRLLTKAQEKVVRTAYEKQRQYSDIRFSKKRAADALWALDSWQGSISDAENAVEYWFKRGSSGGTTAIDREGQLRDVVAAVQTVKPAPRVLDKSRMQYTLICIAADGTQSVQHGYTTEAEFRQEIKRRLGLGKFTRFVVIGSSSNGQSGMHLFDKDGYSIRECFI